MKISSSLWLSKSLSISLRLIITEEPSMSVHIIQIKALLILTEMMKNPVQTQSFNKQIETLWLISTGQLSKNKGITKGDDSENKFQSNANTQRLRLSHTGDTFTLLAHVLIRCSGNHDIWSEYYCTIGSMCVSVCVFYNYDFLLNKAFC